jgi:YfiH family protein
MASSTHATVRRLPESPIGDPVPLLIQPDWAELFPWLVQATTFRGAAAAEFDLRLFGAIPSGEVLKRWELLRRTLGFSRAIHARQVHGARILVHRAGEPAGLLIADSADGHLTDAPGVLLTVSAADCIPISLVDPERRAIALLHGGWRGVAAGIVEEGIRALESIAGSDPRTIHLHLGPAICGDCYEVGPEVHSELGLTVPSRNQPIDLRAIAVDRALALGVRVERVSISAYCTNCSDVPLFSHRGGSAGRQVGILGIRGAAPSMGGEGLP